MGQLNSLIRKPRTNRSNTRLWRSRSQEAYEGKSGQKTRLTSPTSRDNCNCVIRNFPVLYPVIY